jgi:hypothetical protein
LTNTMPNWMRVAATWAGVVLGVCTLAGAPAAQGRATTKLAPPVSAPALLPTLVSIAQAGRTQDYTAEQLRRFDQGAAGVVTVRERLEVDADGSGSPAFRLTYLGVVGEPAGSQLDTKWRHTYQKQGDTFFHYGTFRVRDLALAANNYTLHDFGPIVRAARSARRFVVFPQSVDKAIWVIDVDLATQVPLFVAEFDVSLRLTAELEVLSFQPSVQPLGTPGGSQTTSTLDYTAAATLLGNPAGIIDPVTGVVGEYHLERVQVEQNPLNGQQKLVMTYTDGIDQFVVLQMPGAADPLAGLTGKSGPLSNAGHTIARFRDPALTALTFWEGGVAFHIAGRGALRRLDEVAYRLYRQALSSN